MATHTSPGVPSCMHMIPPECKQTPLPQEPQAAHSATAHGGRGEPIVVVVVVVEVVVVVLAPAISGAHRRPALLAVNERLPNWSCHATGTAAPFGHLTL